MDLDRRRTRPFVVGFLSMPHARRCCVKLPPRSFLLAAGGAAPQGEWRDRCRTRRKGIAIIARVASGRGQGLWTLGADESEGFRRPTRNECPQVSWKHNRHQETRAMNMSIVGWIVIGFIAGALSGALVGGRTARGCLPNVVVGVLGAILGGWLAEQMGFGQIQGFIAAVVVAVFGAIVVRVFLEAISPKEL
jgi:uncharacterized membrane protein YeaQ/YmgE (transglycosylase-associated protein family)